MLFEDTPSYDSWIKWVVMLIPLGLMAAGLVLAFRGEREGLPVLVGEALLIYLIFYFVTPRKYQIYQDKLRIVLGGPLAVNISLASITEARRTSGAKAFGYAGFRLATSWKYVVEIRRSSGMDYVISPSNGDLFLERLHQAMAQAGRYAYDPKRKK